MIEELYFRRTGYIEVYYTYRFLQMIDIIVTEIIQNCKDIPCKMY